MSENTKHKLDTRLEVAFLYLLRFCESNNTELKRKFIKLSEDNIVVVCASANGTHASLGIAEDKLRIFMSDQKVMKWGLMEGFTEDEVYEKLDKQLVKEATLVEVARSLVR